MQISVRFATDLVYNDEEYKMKQENERLKKLSIFRKKQKDIAPIENDIDYQLKESKKNRDDFDISR